MKSYSPKEVIKILLQNGWKLDRTKGGHYIFNKEKQNNIVTVPIGKRIVPIGALKNIEKQSGIKFK